jgi:uncharacterized protein (DUF427 family)
MARIETSQMAKSPGHQQWPEHQVIESRVDTPMRVEVDGNVVADSADVIRVDESGHPTRYYFSRTDVCMDVLSPTGKTSDCPFKGKADHFDLQLGERRLGDAAWSYESPFDEHIALRGRIAFDDDRHPELQIVGAGPGGEGRT